MSSRSLGIARLPNRALRISRAYATDPSPSESPYVTKESYAPPVPLYDPSTPSSIAPPANAKQKRPANRIHPPGHIERTLPVPHLMTLADLAPEQIASLLKSAIVFKHVVKQLSPLAVRLSLSGRTVAMVFNKRSTRTRVASETAINLLGGSGMFLGSSDIQLGVNETLEDSAKIIGGMADGIMARVGDHADIETLAKHSQVPVINALSDRYHPTQILADIMVLQETYAPEVAKILSSSNYTRQSDLLSSMRGIDVLAPLKGKKVAYVGDTNNITNELLVTLPRMGMKLAIASPKGYDKIEEVVWSHVMKAKTEGMVTLTNSPEEAIHDADVVATDTWISMGMEEEKSARLEAFKGFQITNGLVESSGAKADWKFIHCLPRKQEEVDDEVFHGPRSLVFPEAENRKWTTMACFDYLYGRWRLP